MSHDECLELKNIKYKTMLLNNNNNINTKKNESIMDIDSFLKKDKESNRVKSWSKLSNASKLQKILVYSDEYTKTHNLSEEQCKNLKQFLIESMEKKKLQRIKDVTYDVKKNKIINIHGLTFNTHRKKFTLKSKDRKTNTLKSLPPFHKHKSKKEKTKKRSKQIKKQKMSTKQKTNDKQKTNKKRIINKNE